MTPATIKGVLVHEGLALLGRNPRDEWELLGGQPDASDRTVADTLTREFREESGIDIAVGRLLLADLFEVIPGRRVVVVAFAVSVLRSERLTSIMPSSGPAGAPEHTALQWFPCSELPAALPQVYRRAIAAGTMATERKGSSAISVRDVP